MLKESGVSIIFLPGKNKLIFQQDGLWTYKVTNGWIMDLGGASLDLFFNNLDAIWYISCCAADDTNPALWAVIYWHNSLLS
jgi:hypothetical protein